MYFKHGTDARCPEVSGACEHGETPLHATVEKGHFDIVKMLVEAGADVNVEDDTSKAPLRLAQMQENKEIGEFLLENGARKLSELEYLLENLELQITLSFIAYL
ncbi:hypothetical protein F4811DRAFT_571760 [Daldinia bambusicola]|nr:hypothetical protein F4811DRAFT_571760 [Daldinia bambusicola]